MTETSRGLPFPRKRARASTVASKGRSSRQDLKLHPCATLAGTNSWCQLEHGGREFRKLSTAQRHPSRPSIAVLTQSSLSTVFESRSDPIATQIYHPRPVTPWPSWYACLSLFVPPHHGLCVSLMEHTAHVCRFTASLESRSWTDTVNRWSTGDERSDCGSTLQHCSQNVTRLFYM